ncbi:hypothetical protein B5X24_HaOG200858 [Helicoverpa armigera]|uniref:Gustatory receptor n=1 Tax=Helicoverpa armigera TaxID=29058 RepID=A0A2W1BI01_HELAM|nr:hypothetical protein B5X24_HaOG200858 [Helicoverpa armigera]
MEIFVNSRQINSNNIVDSDVQSMLLPLNLLQNVFFCPKYRIKNNYITPTNLMSNLISSIATLVFIIMYAYRNYLIGLFKTSQFSTAWKYSSYFNGFCYSLGFIMNLVIGIIQSQNSVQFVLTFQNVHRFLKNENGFRSFIIWNWVAVCLTLVYYVFFFIYQYTRGTIGKIHACVGFLLSSFDFNVVYATRLLRLLEYQLVLWNNRFFKLRETSDIRDKDIIQKLFNAYANILECYDIIKISFQHYVSFTLQLIIDLLKYAANNDCQKTVIIAIRVSIAVLLWLIKNLMWQMTFSHQCERLYLANERTLDHCAFILTSYCSGMEKRLCKNVLRMSRVRFSKLRVCGLFYAGAALQLSLIALLADYTIVLLQLAFL